MSEGIVSGNYQLRSDLFYHWLVKLFLASLRLSILLGPEYILGRWRRNGKGFEVIDVGYDFDVCAKINLFYNFVVVNWKGREITYQLGKAPTILCNTKRICDFIYVTLWSLLWKGNVEVEEEIYCLPLQNSFESYTLWSSDGD